MSNDSKPFTHGPDRIWADLNMGLWLGEPQHDRKPVAPTEYVRADIVGAAIEMYLALKKAELLYQVGLIKAPDGLFDEVNNLRAAALLKAHGASS